MRVHCDLCGGDNEISPGQEMLRCAYCGSSLAVETRMGPDHLILPHQRDDEKASRAVVSLLAHKRLSRPRDIKVEFAYVPYVMIEDEKSRSVTRPAPGAPRWAVPLPFPPAGDYSFFDATLAGEETCVDAGRLPEKTLKLLHVPLYRVTYRASGKTWHAVVTGESLLVQGRELPPPRARGLDIPNLLAGGAIFTALMFVGAAGGNVFARAVLIFSAAGAGLGAATLIRRSRSRA